MIRNIKRVLKTVRNIPGWRTKRHLVVFESDDWGSIRMPSNKVRDNLIASGVLTSNRNDSYYLFDSLESNDDMVALFETLSSCSDFKGNKPVFTAVSIMANPDFEQIRDNDFNQYYYEPFVKTLDRYPAHDRVYDLWKEGFSNKLFVPQFHGREHLNVSAWMKALRSNQSKTRIAFENQVTGINPVLLGESNVQYQAAFDITDPSELNYLESVIHEGLILFEELLDYKACYFVPTNGPFNLSLGNCLSKHGVGYIMLDKFQREPLGNGKYRTHFRWMGKKNNTGQIVLSRNAAFEPSDNPEIDWVGRCLSEVDDAFRWNKPAVISTHRVNYIGYLDESNRTRNLAFLKRLITEILKKWPDVEFITSVELGEMISNGE